MLICVSAQGVCAWMVGRSVGPLGRGWVVGVSGGRAVGWDVGGVCCGCVRGWLRDGVVV